MAKKIKWSAPFIKSLNNGVMGMLSAAVCTGGLRDGGTCTTGYGAGAFCGAGDAPTGENCINGEYPGGTCVPGGID